MGVENKNLGISLLENRLAQDIIKTICDLYNSGMTIRLIAHKIGYHHKTVSKYLKQNGFTIINKGNKGKHLPIPAIQPANSKTDRNNKIIGLYQQGYGSLTIARALKISKGTVLVCLKKNNIVRNHKYGTIYRTDHSIVIDMYKAGNSIEQIAYKLSTNSIAISKIINKYMPSRTPGQSMSSIAGREQEIVALYESGLSSYDVASRLNLNNPDTIARFLKKNGKLRNSAEVHKLTAQKLCVNGYRSSNQRTIENLFNEFNVVFESEFLLGDGWLFDIKCGNILFEIQSYFHKFPQRIQRDIKKHKVAKENGYKIVYIWDIHIKQSIEFVRNLIKYHLFKKFTDFDFNDIVIVKNYKLANELMKYHYYGKMGRSKHPFVALLNGMPIASCIFSAPIRQEVASRLKLKSSEVLELSRFVVHPDYQKKNFASWLISRCIAKIGDSSIKALISYADLTYGHEGIIYKALGWKFDGSIPSDYWYIINRTVYHKRGIWSRAKKAGITEKQYVIQNNITKVYGMPKNRYVRWL